MNIIIIMVQLISICLAFMGLALSFHGEATSGILIIIVGIIYFIKYSMLKI